MITIECKNLKAETKRKERIRSKLVFYSIILSFFIIPIICILIDWIKKL